MIKQKSDPVISPIRKSFAQESPIPCFFALKPNGRQNIKTDTTPQSPSAVLESKFALGVLDSYDAQLCLTHANSLVLSVKGKPSQLTTTYELKLDFTVSFSIKSSSGSCSIDSLNEVPRQRFGKTIDTRKPSISKATQSVNTTSETDRTDTSENARQDYLRIYKHQHTGTLTLYPESSEVLRQWYQALGKILNQRGFHEQFKSSRKIGRGNFASVYLGQRISDKKQYAVKAFSKFVAYADQYGIASIENQIKICKLLQHPNLVRFEKVMETDSSLYVLLNYVEGSVLGTLLQLKNKFSQDETRNIMRGLLNGVMYLSEKGIVHRDLKPQNVILKRDTKEPVIVDFGLSTFSDQEKYLFTKCGTPGYVSPQILNIKSSTTTATSNVKNTNRNNINNNSRNAQQKCKPVADVFSLGCIFYELVFGKQLFNSRNFHEIMQLNKECDFDLTGGQWKRIPEKTADLMRQMLQKNPEYRISAKNALQHSYFKSEPKIFTPKISLKNSALSINPDRPSTHIIKPRTIKLLSPQKPAQSYIQRGTKKKAAQF